MLNADTLPFFESKALAIVNEQMLSNRLRAQGCATVDATWLAVKAKLQKRSARSTGLLIPDWRVQVTSRDVDAAPASVLL